MSETIQDNKFVELTYKVTDKKYGHVLTAVEFPLGYVHGHNEILAPSVHMQLEGKAAGDVIEVPIDGNQIFGARDESLVFTDDIENVPEEYRQVGTSILMENDQGQTRSFLVTRMDDKTLEILTVRDATDEEMNAGGAIGAQADIDPSLMRPV
jgi:FKBP-type peptidyl-prolyl cis-trans isomerase SlyD